MRTLLERVLYGFLRRCTMNRKQERYMWTRGLTYVNLAPILTTRSRCAWVEIDFDVRLR